MDLCAELTLQLLRFVQMPAGPPASPTGWTLAPDCVTIPWLAVRELLSSVPKPVIVAPLSEPGMFGMWDVAVLRGDTRARIEHQIANQLLFARERLPLTAGRDDALVLFESEADKLRLPYSDLMKWLREYVLVVGWTVQENANTGEAARLLARRPDTCWSPGLEWHVHHSLLAR